MCHDLLIRAAVVSLLCLTGAMTACNQKEETTAQRQDRRFREDAQKVFAEIEAMTYKDQEVRYLFAYGTADTLAIDSLIEAYASKGINLDSVVNHNTTLLVSARFRDSIAGVMVSQDETHTKRMIELINEYGYPDPRRIDSSVHVSPALVMHHPPLAYKDTMLALLGLELRLGRIDSVSFQLIKWDYNGRVGLPELEGAKTGQNADGSTTITF